ncbi:hypothetical protein T4D_10749 [Trichinella pseudospiralis]|uniref:Uncharacterized protein n=1 Tax=Trichinella pseudospiralis TaxID=6337 RepID=A0A0V1DLT7_TRIPS|nr:hypothetical protein T4D_10749 [Trichinella pseudospiralis]
MLCYYPGNVPASHHYRRKCLTDHILGRHWGNISAIALVTTKSELHYQITHFSQQTTGQ